MSDERRIVRQVCGAGKWFPGDRDELQNAVGRFIEKAKVPAVEGRIVGAIAPHAGYTYSGAVAGATFRAIRDNAAGQGAPETVVVLGLSHRAHFSGVALLDGTVLVTPLGETPLDTEAAALLTAAEPRMLMDHRPHMGEHSAENEVPFLQAALPGARLVVGLIGDHDAAMLDGLVAALGKLAAGRKILVVASSDMLHDPNYDRVRKTDAATLRKVAAMDITGIMRAWDFDEQIFCGIGPVVAAMKFAQAQGCTRGTQLQYRNSGDDFPESRGQWVVGYGAVAFAV